MIHSLAHVQITDNAIENTFMKIKSSCKKDYSRLMASKQLDKMFVEKVRRQS